MPFRSLRLLKFLCLPLCLAAVLPACTSVRSKPPDTVVVNDRADSAISNQSRKMFAERNSMIVTRLGALELTTRMATPAEVPEETYKMAMGSPAIGAGSLALGLMAPPMFASALVVGGVLLIPLGTHLYFSEKRIWDAINTVLSNTVFTRAIDSAAAVSLKTAIAGKSLPPLKAEIIIESLGLLKTSSLQPYCLIASARVIISRNNDEPVQEQMQITNGNKSGDSPPPQCARLERFAADDARLLRDALDEYAHVLAHMAVERILRKIDQ